jgi:hypothetical protein
MCSYPSWYCEEYLKKEEDNAHNKLLTPVSDPPHSIAYLFTLGESDFYNCIFKRSSDAFLLGLSFPLLFSFLMESKRIKVIMRENYK